MFFCVALIKEQEAALRYVSVCNMPYFAYFICTSCDDAFHSIYSSTSKIFCV